MNIHHKWMQSYNPNNRWERLFYATKLIQAHDSLVELDRLEPITDLTQANKYLNKFYLKKGK